MTSDPITKALRAAANAGRLYGPKVLVGVSGGVDSTVLAHALAGLREELGLQIAFGHVHHGLRAADADEDEAFARSLAALLGADFASVRVEPASLRDGRSSRERPTLQEAARSLRLGALRDLASKLGADQVALAHHADDQAETVLLRLLRGCSPDSLAGIAEASPDGELVRPLLGVPRREIVEYATREQLSWREDASNGDLSYSRNRLRHRWLPGLAEDFNPQLLRAIGRLAEAQRRDSEWIESQVAQEAARRFSWREGGLFLSREGWSELPESLSRRLARRAMTEMGAGRDVTSVHLRRFCDFVASGRPGSEVELPGGIRLRRRGDQVSLGRVETETAC